MVSYEVANFFDRRSTVAMVARKEKKVHEVIVAEFSADEPLYAAS
jgi:hypothetical protein